MRRPRPILRWLRLLPRAQIYPIVAVVVYRYAVYILPTLPNETYQMAIPTSVTDFFNYYPDFAHLDVLLPDLNGILRGKRLIREQALKPWSNGIALSGSVFCFNVLGEPVESSGLSLDIGDRDYNCRPIDNTLSLSPSGNAQVMVEMLEDDGTAYLYSPRHALQKQLMALRQENIHPTVAIELEFYLLKQGNKPVPIDNPTTGVADNNPNTYLIDGLEDYSSFLSDVASVAKNQGLPADTAIVESSPGQFEINLHYRDDPCRACDEALLLKRLIKQVAYKHNYQASFMAKPFAEHCGNGMHVHFGLYDNDGANLLLNESMLEQAIAGLQQSMADFMLLFAPHGNSYRRLVEGAYVPLTPTWGENNRTVALRLPLSDPNNRRIEHRVSGADANPYLVVAAILSGIRLGLEQQLKPSSAIKGNAYKQVEPSLPIHWSEAVSQFCHSSIAKHYLGPTFHGLINSVKQEELSQYRKLVPSLDYDWYLRTI